jgi:hypothetical protein
MRPTQIEKSFAMCIFFIKAHCTCIELKEFLTFSHKGQPWGNLHIFIFLDSSWCFMDILLFLSIKVDCS